MSNEAKKSWWSKLFGSSSGNSGSQSAPKQISKPGNLRVEAYVESGDFKLATIQALSKPFPDLDMVYLHAPEKQEWKIKSFGFGPAGSFAKGLFTVTVSKEGGHNGTLKEGDILEFVRTEK